VDGERCEQGHGGGDDERGDRIGSVLAAGLELTHAQAHAEERCHDGVDGERKGADDADLAEASHRCAVYSPQSTVHGLRSTDD
jgi:hypothetical protein